MIYLIPIALLCVLNSAIGADLQCENGNCTYSDEATTSIDLSTILDKVNNQDNITNLTINTPKANLTGTATDDKKIELGGGNYPITITAQELKMTGKDNSITSNYYTSTITSHAPLTINGHLNITETSLQVHNTLGTPLWEQNQFVGSLRINGDFTAKNSNIQKNVSTNAELQNFVVSGKSDITDTIFIVYSPDKNDTSINKNIKQLMLTSNGGFNSDITTANEAQFKIRVDTTMLEKAYYFKILDEYSSEVSAPIGDGDGVIDKAFSTKLKLEGKNLYVVREIDKGFKDLELAKVGMDLEAVNAEIAKFDKYQDGNGNSCNAQSDNCFSLSELSPTERDRLKKLQKVIEEKQKTTQNQTDEEIAESYNRQNGSQYGSVTLSAITATDKELVGATIASDLFFNNGDGAVKETIDSSTQIADDGGQSQSVTAQNMQSEMATTTRMAKFSNPYAKVYYAQNTMTTQRALNGDIRSDVPLTPYFTTNELLNNVWANLFGGANIIGENVGEIYGLNAGYDRRIGAHFLGGYVSYAYATMKDSHINQTTHNIQAGLYSRLVFGKNEIDIKWSAQAGITKQNRYVVNLSNDANFTRAFMGLNGSYGHVFKMGKGVFLKPMLGVNFYFSYTPKYSEKGDLAQTIQAMSSTNLSVDIGADLRAYWNEDSFFYIVPKFEQYVLTQNDDFVGAFVGSPNNFRITAQNKLKTYFQGIIGVDIGVYQGLAITLSGGVKQIISEHVDSRNETFISGNLGVKYRF